MAGTKADLSFEIAPRRKEAITFTLGGDTHKYAFTPPKKAAMITVMMSATSDLEAAKGAFGWLDDGLSTEDRDKIAARLKDPEDDLDIDTIEQVVSALVERTTGRPTS